MKFPGGRSDPDRAAGVELADRIRQMIVGEAEPRQIAAALAEAPIGPARSALEQLLAKPYVLIPDDWEYQPASGLAANGKLDEAIGDAGVAWQAAQSLLMGPGHSQQLLLSLAHFLVTAIERVPDGDLRDVVRSLLMVIEAPNDLKILGRFRVPPPPPPRPLMEAVGALHKRDRELAWTVLQALARGHSNLARVLRRVASLDVPKGSVPQEADSLLDLVELAGAVKGPAPTASWLKRWLEVRARGGPALRATVLAVADGGEKDDDGLWRGGSGADLVRAAVLALSSWDDEETRAFLQRTILMWARSGSGSPSIGTAAVWSLASYGDSQAMISLLDIKRRIRHKTLLKRIDQEVEQLSKKLGMSADDVADESVSDCGLGDDGTRTWRIGDYTFSLAFGLDGTIRRAVTAPSGKAVKDVPGSVRKEHGEQWADITTARRLLDETIRTQRARLEEAMIDGRNWTAERWQRVFAAHPVMRNLARRLVWEETGSGTLAMPDGERFTESEMLAGGAMLRVAHPVTMSARDQSHWQHEVVSRRVVQPFKQVFRETYFVTPAEISEHDRSHRFSGHVIPNQMMYALARGRGWSGTMGLSGFDGSGQGSREFKTWDTRAHIEQDWTENEDFSTISEVYFERRDPGGPWYRADLESVPKIPFSEAMRDVDLVVAVASIGTDNQWLEWEAQRAAGTVNWNDQREAYSSLASAAASVRGRMIEEMLPLLGGGERVKVAGHFAHVKGRLGEYRIHLGSGNIHAEPSGRYICIVRSGGGDKNWASKPVYLPFEDPDIKSAEVVSKILLLLKDDEIKDPVITAQLPGGRG